jgi:hypothetical protein
MAGSRKDQYDITVTVDGRNLGTWDKMTGGDIDSDEMTYKPGGMGSRISLGGSVNVANVIVSVIYDLKKIHPLIHWLIARVGKANVTIKKQPLDVDGNASGMRSITYTGKLKRVTPPEVDSEASDAALLELEMTPVGTVA